MTILRIMINDIVVKGGRNWRPIEGFGVMTDNSDIKLENIDVIANALDIELKNFDVKSMNLDVMF